jgi:kumamolisin
MQQSGGIAPGAKIVHYNVPDLSDPNLLSALITMVEINAVDVVNMSFGCAEDFYTAAYNGGQDFTGILAVYDDLFAQGNAQGITFIASSGDQGALSLPPVSCLEPGATSDCGSYLQAVEFPASSPHVTGVGGTNLVTTSSPTSLNSKYISENAHSDPVTQDLFIGTPATGNIWGSGGGNSIYFKKPDYQKLVTTGSKFRTVPDLALHMGGCPQGAVLPCGLDRSSDVVAIGGGLFGVIGTSASAPDFAGLTALKIERLSTRLGNENFDIYSLAANQAAGSGLTVYRNNIPGDNGVFNSKKGYNRVIGNGSVIGVNFLLAPTVQAAGTPQTPTNP